MKSNVQQHICLGFLMDQRNWLWLTVTWNSKDQHQIPVWSLISGMLVSLNKYTSIVAYLMFRKHGKTEFSDVELHYIAQKKADKELSFNC